MKTVKRIFAILLLVVTVALIGYLSFTGSRLSHPDGIGGTSETIQHT